MKITVQKKKSFTKRADGTEVVGPEPKKEEQDSIQARVEDLQVSEALKHFDDHRDIAPLLELFEESNPAILRSKKAINLISRAAKGEKIKGQGRVRKKQDIESDLQIAKAVYWLNTIGVPVKNSKGVGNNKPSACLLVGNRVCLSDNAVNDIVKKMSYTPSIFDLVPFDTSTPEAILRYFFPEPEEEEMVIKQMIKPDVDQ